jgi:DNA polymerase III alpha subunit
MFKTEGWEQEFFIPVYEHFGKNFYLETQSHNVDIQKKWNSMLLDVKKRYDIQLIHANDSHYIYPEDSHYRDLFLKAKGIYYEEETGFILDYPDVKTIVKRYQEQGVLSDEEIAEAINNTLIFDKAESINLNREFKIPHINNDILL